jgi:hypothetical protein
MTARLLYISDSTVRRGRTSSLPEASAHYAESPMEVVPELLGPDWRSDEVWVCDSRKQWPTVGIVALSRYSERGIHRAATLGGADVIFSVLTSDRPEVAYRPQVDFLIFGGGVEAPAHRAMERALGTLQPEHFRAQAVLFAGPERLFPKFQEKFPQAVGLEGALNGGLGATVVPIWQVIGRHSLQRAQNGSLDVPHAMAGQSVSRIRALAAFLSNTAGVDLIVDLGSKEVTALWRYLAATYIVRVSYPLPRVADNPTFDELALWPWLRGSLSALGRDIAEAALDDIRLASASISPEVLAALSIGAAVNHVALSLGKAIHIDTLTVTGVVSERLARVTKATVGKIFGREVGKVWIDTDDLACFDGLKSLHSTASQRSLA